MSLTLRALADAVGGRLIGDGDQQLRGAASLDAAGPDDLTYADTPEHLAAALAGGAGAVIAVEGAALGAKSGVLVANPRLAFARALALLYPVPPPPPGAHPTVSLGRDVQLGEGASVGAKAVLGSGVRIGARTRIEPGAALGPGVTVGADGFIGPNVVVYAGVTIGDRVRIHGGTVVGSDGFGYVFDRDHYEKIPQVGTVVIEDDVELGANVCVDRATTGLTRIGRGTKVDNQVQIAHNDRIGAHVILPGQTGISGSVTVGDYALFGARTGVGDHLTVGSRVQTGICTNVIGNVPDGQVVFGYAGRPVEEAKTGIASLARLPQTRHRALAWLRRLAGVEARLDAAEARLR